MAVNDLYTQGIAAGWDVRDASSFTSEQTLEADVAIVGSGAGGGTAAEILSAAGLRVLLLEEGPLQTAADFKDMDEARAYSTLYQEAAGRATSDGAIGIFQGRAVGGTTVVNWTSSFRTPAETLEHWQRTQALQDASVDDMAPWFARAEARLGVQRWAGAPNANNAVLQRAAEKLGWEWHVIPRNVRGCWNLGYCGLGCPSNAKQSMLVTTIPEALRNRATLVHHLRVQRVRIERGSAVGLEAQALDPACLKPTGVQVRIRARHYVLAAGAINTPALLLRSGAPDPHGTLGKRTCVHPVVLTLAQMPERIDGWYGAPQSVATDEFQWKDGATGPAGFKIEVPPLQPGLASTIFANHGSALAQQAAQMSHTQALLALVRDGFHPRSQGGTVRVDPDSGAPILDYDIDDYLWDGFRRAYLRMAEAQFAAGARAVMPAHLDGRFCSSWEEARTHIENLAYEKHRVGLVTAHLMGGCAMGEDRQRSVTNSHGRHHQLAHLSVFDGSLFPTSIGANPQLSIYGFVTKHASRLAAELAS